MCFSMILVERLKTLKILWEADVGVKDAMKAVLLPLSFVQPNA